MQVKSEFVEFANGQRDNSKLQPTRCNISWFIFFYRRCTGFR